MKNYIICTTQRSGKTWLCQTLQNLGGFGYPHEYVDVFHKGFIGPKILVDKGVDGLQSYIENKTIEKTGSKSPTALALQWNQLVFLKNKIKKETQEILRYLVEKYDYHIFFLKRRDILQQSISQFIHQRSGYAHSYQENDTRLQRFQVKFDPESIKQHYISIQTCYESWQNLFNDIEVNFRTIYYEEMSSDISHIVRLISSDIQKNLTDISMKSIMDASSSLLKVSDEVDKNFRQQIDSLVLEGRMSLPGYSVFPM
jgi:LPS sulfotransferase NodH